MKVVCGCIADPQLTVRYTTVWHLGHLPALHYY